MAVVVMRALGAAVMCGAMAVGCFGVAGCSALVAGALSVGGNVLAGAATSARAGKSTATVGCKVVGVLDGDTIDCLQPGNVLLRVRLDQIDAPEKGQAFGDAAKKQLSNYVYGQDVKLKVAGLDKYRRTLAEVFVGSLNVNMAMVRDGYAWAYVQYVRNDWYLRAQESAIIGERGLWRDENPIYPADFRRGAKAGAGVAMPQQVANTDAGATGAVMPLAPVARNMVSKQAIAPAQAGAGAFTCSGKTLCREMRSCAEARFYLTKCGASRLDRDSDGVPCESLCR